MAFLRFGIDDNAVAAGSLGAVKRFVGLDKHLVGVFGVFGDAGDPPLMVREKVFPSPLVKVVSAICLRISSATCFKRGV